MQRAFEASEGTVSEMAIVDTFTKLIFGEEHGYSDREEIIIHAFRSVDGNVALDSYQDMGKYLRALGVREMIQLVSRVREQLLAGLYDSSAIGGALADVGSHSAVNRRAH